MMTIKCATLPQAWHAALDAVLRNDGRAIHVVTSWTDSRCDSQVQDLLDRFLAKRNQLSTRQVADTIFPIEYFSHEHGSDALARFSALYLETYPLLKKAVGGDEYCHRLIAWAGPDGVPVNQLLEIAQKLRRFNDPADRYHYRSTYELALEQPSLDLRTQMPGRNGDPYGFPCLSHISVTAEIVKCVDPVRGRRLLHLLALYRNQHLVSKAYGNYLGLVDLARALCHHSDLELGSITVVAAHADAEISAGGRFGKATLRELRDEVATVLGASSHSTEGVGDGR